MNIVFETLINDMIENEVGISNLFLSKTLSGKIYDIMSNFQHKISMKQAGIGNLYKINTNNSIRKDKIKWLDVKNNSQIEIEFLDQVDLFVNYLNKTCFAGITQHEFHYSLYQKGDYYKKHIDQFGSNNQRLYTIICYFNHWKAGDGGELQVYKESGIELIEPMIGTMLFFKSDTLAHEVLPCFTDRLSITGWLKQD